MYVRYTIPIHRAVKPGEWSYSVHPWKDLEFDSGWLLGSNEEFDYFTRSLKAELQYLAYRRRARVEVPAGA
jgi:hypothetical protein